MSGRELKPCPFCGGEPIAYNYDPYRGELGGAEHVAVLCTCCGARIIRPTHEDAVARWNRRDGNAEI